MDPRRVAFWMLATAGVAVGHIAGYALAHPGSASREAALSTHGYLPAAASVLIPLGVLAALGWAIATSRQLGMGNRISPRHLAMAQIAIFAVQEVGERVVGGQPLVTVAHERGVWIGLVAQIVVALLVVRAVNLARRVVRYVCAGRRLVVRSTPRTPISVPVVSWPAPQRRVAVGLRAPPFVAARLAH